MISNRNFFFYVMGSHVLPHLSSQTSLTDLNIHDHLQSISWGMWYSHTQLQHLTSASQLYIWDGDDGNLLKRPSYTKPVIQFAQGGGQLGVTLGGNPPSTDKLINPISHLYQKPDDFIKLLLSIQSSLNGYLDFIDLDIENPQLDEWTTAHWTKLNATLNKIRQYPSTKEIKILLTIPQASNYWSHKPGYQALRNSDILKNTAIDFINIMDMDTKQHPQASIWINWIAQTQEFFSLDPQSEQLKTVVTFESNTDKMTTDLFEQVIRELIRRGYHYIALFKLDSDGLKKFKTIIQGNHD
ncbi:MAG: hypothetical protein CENE_03748 [Candidatus Celerinatantimonas neptuna]|nr:MAG: hypothetical protein CENE_03748 [Candidatus Celerinatantimonas neptuna]